MNGIKKQSTDHSWWVLTMCVWDTHIDAHSCHYHLQLLAVRNSHFLQQLFIHFWPCWAFTATRRLSPVAAGVDYSLVCLGFSLLWLLLLQSSASRVQLQWLWYPSSDALQHVESSLKRDGTRILVLAGRFLTTGPPGKYRNCNFKGILLDSDSDKNTKTWL